MRHDIAGKVSTFANGRTMQSLPTDALALILDAIPLGVAVINREGVVMHLNKAYQDLTGARGEDYVGLECFHALRCDHCVKSCPVFQGDVDFEPVIVDADIITRERRKVPIWLTLSSLSEPDGTFIGVIETLGPSGPVSSGETDSVSFGLGGFIGKSEQIETLIRMLPIVSQTDSSVLITGETGTGKDMLAEEIHNASGRANGPFIKVNCGALPDTLLESELFGHTKGAFTGADQNKPGRIRLAQGGTLFLTEIGDFPLGLQVKLLSFLDDKVIYPLGSSKGVHVDVRVIVATHRNLEEMVRQGRFRQDLLYRLNVIRLMLPPLRGRREDVVLLQDHFLKTFQARFNRVIDGFSPSVNALLKDYPYPGNVRELRNIIEYAVNFCDGKIIRMRHLPAYLIHAGTEAEATREADLPGVETGEVMNATSAAGEGETNRNWDDVQRSMILEALVRAGGRKQGAAKILGWGRSTLWRKMKRLGIE